MNNVIMPILPKFQMDPYPGKPKVLFVGFSESSHTHSWIDLLSDAPINVRLFALPTGTPPDNWIVKTYLTSNPLGIPASDIRASLDNSQSLHQSLANIIRDWQPHIIHTLGLEPAGYFYFEVREAFHLREIGNWVLQLRGGSDLALNQFDSDVAPMIVEVLKSADQILGDNQQNYEIAEAFGVRKEQISTLGTVPGTGGIDVSGLLHRWQGNTSSRRVIIFPKAYNTPWSLALPVLEALQLCWKEIQPCEVHMLAMTSEVMLWYRALPEHIKQFCHVNDRVPRQQLFDLLTRSRVLLAPSLVDGTPNTMFEAMATGAFPIVSPLDTLTPIVQHEHNVLFARNLYPDEIANALMRAMNDDNLVNQSTQANVELVRQIADRAKIGPRVIDYYIKLASRASTEKKSIMPSAGVSDYPFSHLSTLMPEGQQHSILLQEYAGIQNQFIELQNRFAALQQESMNIQEQLRKCRQDYAML